MIHSQQQSLMEAAAIAKQVENIAQALSPNKDAVTSEDRKFALATLVELRRLDQLQAIAKSKSNSTYFFGDKAALGGANDAFNVDYAQAVKRGMEKTPVRAPGPAVGAVVA